ncbi:hypothetical protein [Streptomyces sp. ISL-94]|uniref:hypothetical protein n=1 Tax=Streptomyces sp. ISL-94 TaxID=2819190 RepID=UPI001BEB602C|nr:hypothetical protein [Streptomyces sp. ISL-94]MBT2478272.1 hypothetical protein [Streptomyces sp. ISL-94]
MEQESPLVQQDAPLVRDVFPDLASELVRLLEEEDERDLALCAYDLRLVEACGCGDGFCQSIRTHPHPEGTPYGPGHRMVALDPGNGFLNIDVIDGRIVYVEIVDRPPLRRASPQPPAGAEAEHPDS